MKKQFSSRLVAFLLLFCMLFLNSCSLMTLMIDDVSLLNNVITDNRTNGKDVVINNSGLPESEYVEGVVLVKYTGDDANVFADFDIKSVEALYEGSTWYSLELNDSTKTEEMVQELIALDVFDCVDYDYIMKSDAETESIDVSGNPGYNSNQKNQQKVHGVKDAWDYLKKEGQNPGGSADVIVAVIDTGVDYNHEDLRNNIWTNLAEIPNNGKDDDGNGYIDDVYGWDCVSDDNDPMDDNGHGTHVAGIIAAENNKLGGVGIAYNCKVMVIKAGNSSGHFNNSDIAEAIQYAYMNGASVINMSFGGYSISVAVEEALEEAYSSCILIAAAGNDSRCSLPGCFPHNGAPCFPAALSYVIGVMSVNDSGANASGFSNFNHPDYNQYKYNVYATGESVYSCWPNNKYATLSGTSMAAPVVAGIAALLRANYSDREIYSSKYIQSQIVNTGTINPTVSAIRNGYIDREHTVVNVYNALTKLPTPSIYAMNYYIDDSTSISANNNANGAIDAGETIHLYCSFFNKGGVASNVKVFIDTMRNNDPSLTDPYFTLVNTSFELSDIGTYSERTSGEKYFEIVVDSDCPNDYLINFNIRLTYKNGMDEKDKTNYAGVGVANFNISNGYHLPSIIPEDTIFTADKLYIVGENVVIPEGVTVVFEEGSRIQFYDGRDYYNSPYITNYGTLKFEGTKEHQIDIFPSESYSTYVCMIRNYGELTFDYVEGINIFPTVWDSKSVINISNSAIRQQKNLLRGGSVNNSIDCIYQGEIGTPWITREDGCWVRPEDYTISNSYIEVISCGDSPYYSVYDFENCFICLGVGLIDAFNYESNFKNNIIYTAHTIGSDYYHYSHEVSFKNAQNNMIINDINGKLSITRLKFDSSSLIENNLFSETYKKYADQVINGYYTSTGMPIVDVNASLADASLLWPHVVSVEMFDKYGSPITTVGKEQIKVRVTFNRPMDTTQNTTISFGTIEPYADYVIKGEYVSDTVWEGTYTLKAQIENGQNYLKVNNACAAEDPTKTVFGEYHLHEFTIDTTAAMSMDLIANSTTKGIELTWAQDDHDTLMGYNIYRSESKNGNYEKINPSVVLDAYSTYIDTDLEVGKTYWYTFTVVLSDFTESAPAGIVSATAMDTIPPTITHTPVTQGYFNNNLRISCTASDNVGVTSVTLYYRTVGETEWHTLKMSKAGSQYSTTIYGSSLTAAGLEYYIVASDGLSDGFYGDANTPIRVDIKCATGKHDFTGELFSNEEGHWHICSLCGEKESVIAHTPGSAATTATPQTCTKCGFVIKPALGHTHDYKNEYVKNEQQHWYECDCGARIIVEDHVFDNVCDPDCNKCGYKIERGHVYDNNCDTQCNRCGETRETEHTYDEGVVTKEPTTTKYGEMTYTCTVCGAEKYEDIDMLVDEEQKPNDEQKPDDEKDSKGGCYVATCVYGSYDCPEVWTLRRFRDDILSQTWIGRLFIRTYYAISPTLVNWFGETNWFKNMWRGTLDWLVDALNDKGVEDTPYNDKEWE